MSTPQNTLNNLDYAVRHIRKLLEGEFEEGEEAKDIYEICKSIEIEVSEFNERMDRLGDQMALIIKLLSK